MDHTSHHTETHETILLLNTALSAGHIKPETCANAGAWLADSYARVAIEGETVGAYITRLVQAQDWQTLNDSFFKVNKFGTAGVRGRLAIGTAHFNTIVLGLGVEAHAAKSPLFWPMIPDADPMIPQATARISWCGKRLRFMPRMASGYTCSTQWPPRRNCPLP
jgi:hypothetical protein